MKWLMIVIVMSGISCAIHVPPYSNHGSHLDDCNFHVGQWGVGMKWPSLPVPLTFHNGTMNEDAIQTTLEVVDEWNRVWKQQSKQDHDLFEVIGTIFYDDLHSIQHDQQNTIALLKGDMGSGQSNIISLQSNKQGVTQMFGGKHIVETDIFLNNKDFDFYYETDRESLASRSEVFTQRGIASLEVESSYWFQSLWSWLSNLFFFWKKTIPRDPDSRRRIPARSIDFSSLIAHELGHVLGLGHNEIQGSIMNSQLRYGAVRRGLRPIDLDSLLCGYAKNRDVKF